MNHDALVKVATLLGQAATEELQAKDLTMPEGAMAALGGSVLFKIFLQLLSHIFSTPEGIQAAIGDGAFLAMIIKIIELLLPLILKFFPV